MDFWQVLKTRRKQLGVMVLIALSVAALLDRYQYEYEHEERFRRHRWPGYDMLEVLELKLYDGRMRMRGKLPKPNDIVILAIDHESMSQLGVWPFPRSMHARVVDRLREAGAKIIAFDVDFSSDAPNKEDDRKFAEACARAGNVILAANLEEGSEDVADRKGGDLAAHVKYRQIYPIPELEDACLSTGFISVTEDLDAFIRSSDTAFHDDAFDETLPFFGPMVAGAYQGLDEEQVGKWMDNKLKGKKRIPYLHGYRALINYVGAVRSITTYPYYFLALKKIPKNLDLMNTLEARRKLFKGKIVLIGGTADELQDNKPTPFFQDGKTPGVEVHANVVNMFLTQNYLTRVASHTSTLVLILVALITGLITVLVNKPVSRIATVVDTRLSFSVRGTRVGFYGVTWFLLYLMGAMLPPVAVFGGLNLWCFAVRNVVLPLGYPLVAIAGTYFLGIFYMFLTEEQERKRMHGRFQRFVAPSVLTEILTNPQDAPRPRKVNATVIFTDLQGFTTLSEQMEPEEVVEVLNDYLDRMTNVIFRHAGTIDKFIGDAIMIIFGAPVPQEDHPLRAVRCAVEMQEECARFRRDGRARGWPDFFMRIGIHTDDVVVGSIGSSLRMDYTAIGDGVNLAARLEAANKQYGSWVMCSEDTLKRCGDAVESRLLDAVTVKGKTEAVNVFEILQLKENGQPVGYDLRQIALENEQSESAQKARAAYGKGIGGH